MIIRIASEDEYLSVRAFYHEMTDWLETAKYGPGWKKDIYPSPDELKSALRNKELWVAEENGKYIASMILNSCSNEEYSQIEWQVPASDDEVLLIHALGVMPDYHGTGVSRRMVEHAISIAKRQGKKAMRLDVLDGNIPAERLYPKFGFMYIDTIKMFYEDTGLTYYKLYELAL